MTKEQTREPVGPTFQNRNIWQSVWIGDLLKERGYTFKETSDFLWKKAQEVNSKKEKPISSEELKKLGYFVPSFGAAIHILGIDPFQLENMLEILPPKRKVGEGV